MPAPARTTILGGGVALRRVAMVESLLGDEVLEDILDESVTRWLQVSESSMRCLPPYCTWLDTKLESWQFLFTNQIP